MSGLPFTPFPILSTDRLVLRQLIEADVPEIFLLRSDEEVNRFLDRPRARTPEDAAAFIEKINNGITEGVWIYWTIIPKNEIKLAGTIGLFNINTRELKAEIGYELLPAFHGKGIMSEVLPVVIKFGFEEMGLDTIDAFMHPGNMRSVKVLEKNNFKRNIGAEKEMKSETEKEPLIIYSLNRNSE